MGKYRGKRGRGGRGRGGFQYSSDEDDDNSSSDTGTPPPPPNPRASTPALDTFANVVKRGSETPATPSRSNAPSGQSSRNPQPPAHTPHPQQPRSSLNQKKGEKAGDNIEDIERSLPKDVLSELRASREALNLSADLYFLMAKGKLQVLREEELREEPEEELQTPTEQTSTVSITPTQSKDPPPRTKKSSGPPSKPTPPLDDPLSRPPSSASSSSPSDISVIVSNAVHEGISQAAGALRKDFQRKFEESERRTKESNRVLHEKFSRQLEESITQLKEEHLTPPPDLGSGSGGPSRSGGASGSGSESTPPNHDQYHFKSNNGGGILPNPAPTFDDFVNPGEKKKAEWEELIASFCLKPPKDMLQEALVVSDMLEGSERRRKFEFTYLVRRGEWTRLDQANLAAAESFLSAFLNQEKATRTMLVDWLDNSQEGVDSDPYVEALGAFLSLFWDLFDRDPTVQKIKSKTEVLVRKENYLRGYSSFDFGALLNPKSRAAGLNDLRSRLREKPQVPFGSGVGSGYEDMRNGAPSGFPPDVPPLHYPNSHNSAQTNIVSQPIDNYLNPIKPKFILKSGHSLHLRDLLLKDLFLTPFTSVIYC